MAKLSKILFLFLLVALLIHLPVLPVNAQSPAPTPTYDPFAQPPLPDNPTELELGRYLFFGLLYVLSRRQRSGLDR